MKIIQYRATSICLFLSFIIYFLIVTCVILQGINASTLVGYKYPILRATRYNKADALWKMEIRDDVESQSLLGGISWLPSMQWDTKTPINCEPLNFSYFYCYALVDHLYGWFYLWNAEVAFGHRRLIDQQYFGQFWFFGGYVGLIPNILDRTPTEKQIAGLELTGSKFGQFTFTTCQVEDLSGVSLMYTKVLVPNYKTSIFLFLASPIQQSTLGVGGSYIVYPNFSIKYKCNYFPFDKSIAIELQGEFTLSKKLTHDVFRNTFLRPPEWYLPSNSGSSNTNPHSKHYNSYREFPGDFYSEFNQPHTGTSSRGSQRRSKNYGYYRSHQWGPGSQYTRGNAGTSSRGQQGNRPTSVSSLETQFAEFIGKTAVEVHDYSVNELDSAFRQNARSYHPDSLPPEVKNGPEEARKAEEKAREEQFKKFQNCYEQLKRRKS